MQCLYWKSYLEQTQLQCRYPVNVAFNFHTKTSSTAQEYRRIIFSDYIVLFTITSALYNYTCTIFKTLRALEEEHCFMVICWYSFFPFRCSSKTDILSRCRASLGSLMSRGSSISPKNTMPRIEITSASDQPMPAAAAATNNRKSSCVSVDRFDVRKDNKGFLLKPRALSLA